MMRRASGTPWVPTHLRDGRWLGVLGSALILGLALASAPLSVRAVATAPLLGTARSFGVLAYSTVTNTGPTLISGDLGLYPGTSVTGGPVVVNGTQHVTDAVAKQAQSDLTIAYNGAAGEACDQSLTGRDLGGLRLTAGVYCFSSSAFLTGTLILDGQNDPNAVFVFQIGSTLITAPNSTVSIVNGNPCNVFWQVGSSATLDTTTKFVGTIMALASIGLNTGAQIVPGRALARNGAVTLDTNVITRPDICAPGSSTTTTLTTSPNPAMAGTPVTLAATTTSGVSGTPTPVGNDTFAAGSTVLATRPVDTSGMATVTTSALPPGNNTITALYSGAPGFLPSASPAVVQTVIPAPTPIATPTPSPTSLPSTGHPPGP